VIDTVLGLFDATTTSMTMASSSQEDAERPAAPSWQQQEQQLPELASVLFACVQERLDWLGSAVAASDAANVRDFKELEDRFSQLRPEVLETLRVFSSHWDLFS
jgi:nuclear pore complex protein Nup133